MKLTNVFRRHGKLCLNLILFCLVVTGLIIAVLNLVNTSFPTIKCHGNSTHEPDFSHAFNGDTISTVMILSISFIPPFLELLAVEWILNKKAVNPYEYHTEDTRWQRTRFFAFRWYRDYIFGLVFMLVLVEAGKLSVGAARPHWISSCMPSFPPENCKLGWVSDYTCSNTKYSKYKLIDARKSFPSGHAALSFYAGLFMILYQHFRFNRRKLGPIITLLMHTIWFAWAIVCSLSRVSDYRHHPRDVVFGAILGVIVASFSGIYLCRKFSKAFKYDACKNKIVTGMNGNGPILDGFSSNSTVGLTQLNSIAIASPGGHGNSVPNGGIHLTNGNVPKERNLPSVRKLLTSQSNMSADAVEAREMENL